MTSEGAETTHPRPPQCSVAAPAGPFDVREHAREGAGYWTKCASSFSTSAWIGSPSCSVTVAAPSTSSLTPPAPAAVVPLRRSVV